MKRTTGFYFLVLLLLSGCNCEYTTQAVHWRSKGDVVCKVLSKCRGIPDTVERDHLVLLENNLKKKKEILSGHFDLSVSPNAVDILIVRTKDYSTFSLIDINEAGSRLIRKFQSPFPMDIGWAHNGNSYFFTDSDGIKTSALADQNEKLLVKGQFYGVSWSSDGKNFMYKSGRGWPKGNDLLLLNADSGKIETVYSISKGFIGKGFFTSDDNEFVFSTEDYAQDVSQVFRCQLASKHITEIYKCQRNPMHGVRVLPTNDRSTVLLHANGKLLILNLADSQFRTLADVVSPELWDYNATLNKVLCIDQQGNPRILDLNR